MTAVKSRAGFAASGFAAVDFGSITWPADAAERTISAAMPG
jgi:hypothetical protein